MMIGKTNVAAEHRHDMLAAQPDGSRPTESLAGSDHFTGSDILSVSVQRPDRHDETFRKGGRCSKCFVPQLTNTVSGSETLMQDRDLDVMTICQNPLTEIGNNGGR